MRPVADGTLLREGVDVVDDVAEIDAVEVPHDADDVFVVVIDGVTVNCEEREMAPEGDPEYVAEVDDVVEAVNVTAASVFEARLVTETVDDTDGVVEALKPPDTRGDGDDETDEVKAADILLMLWVAELERVGADGEGTDEGDEFGDVEPAFDIEDNTE